MSYFFFGSALFFIVAAILNICAAKHKIGPFVNKGRLGSVSGVTVGLKEFIEDFNKYLETVNKNNATSNIVAAMANGLSAIFSILAIFNL